MSAIFSQFMYSDALAKNLGETYWRSLAQLELPMRPWNADSYQVPQDALRESFDRGERIVLDVEGEESIVSVDRETGSLNLTLEVQDLSSSVSERQALVILDSLFGSLTPKFAWADRDGEYPKGLVKAVTDTSLNWIFWCNFYGPAYIKRYGLDFFLHAPFATARTFAQQGVRCVTAAAPGEPATAVLQNLRDYFANSKIDILFYDSLI
jgi:hypothetical protein